MKIHKNYKGQICGRLSDDLIYRKEVDSKKHKLHIMDAYGIDKSIVDDLRNDGCTEIRIRENGTRVLCISMEDFTEKSVLRNFDTPQLFVSVKYFTEKEKTV